VGSFSTIGGGISNLSALTIDVDKDWARHVIKNLGAPVDSGDAARKGDIPLTLKKVAEVDVTSAVTSITVTGLDINTHKFYLIIFMVKNPTAGGVWYHLCVEGDTTLTNYYSQYAYWSGTGGGAGRSNDACISSEYAGDEGGVLILVARSPSGYPHAWSFRAQRVGANVSIELYHACKTAAVTNITRIDIVASAAGGIGAGSKLIIYGASG